MAQLTAYVTSLSQNANSKAVKLGLSATLVLVGLYLYLVPNSITVSGSADSTDKILCMADFGTTGPPEEKTSPRPSGLAIYR